MPRRQRFKPSRKPKTDTALPEPQPQQAKPPPDPVEPPRRSPDVIE